MERERERARIEESGVIQVSDFVVYNVGEDRGK